MTPERGPYNERVKEAPTMKVIGIMEGESGGGYNGKVIGKETDRGSGRQSERGALNVKLKEVTIMHAVHNVRAKDARRR